MNILVTGSSGTIGTELCIQLLEYGHNLIGIDWRTNKFNEQVNQLTIQHDLRKPMCVDAFEMIDVVVHLAANARVYDLVLNPELAQDNTSTVFNAINMARDLGAQFIFASSRETYGNVDIEKPAEGDASFQNCESAYTASKIYGEALCLAYNRCYDFLCAGNSMPCTILRFSNVYGKYDFSDRFIPLCFKRLSNDEPLGIFGEEKELDFTYISDAVAGIMLAIDSDIAHGMPTLNIASGVGSKLIDVANMMSDMLGSKSPITIGENRPGEVVKYAANIACAEAALGYRPEVSLEEGIKKALAWYSTHPQS
tara:strand:+ start:748 stop:1677 length:930 start_codon:yes stop_codon:yes gene_type:complete